MSEPWPPPAPPIKKEFENSKDESKAIEPPKEAPEIITKAERDQLEEKIKKHKLEHNFPPPGGAKSASYLEDERRFTMVNQRFEELKHKMQKQFKDKSMER